MLKKNILFIFLFLAAVFLFVSFGLRWYTHHGEKLTLPDYTEMPLRQAVKEARSKSFEIVVIDSIFRVDQKGGVILDQNPAKNAKVKRGRKIYVTITKYTPDKIKVSQIPELYGKNFERKKIELENAFEVYSKAVDYEYDQGAPDQILKVRYKGRDIITSDFVMEDVEIDKGDTLQFVLSKNIGGAIIMPDLVCMKYSEAAFYAENLNLVIGDVSMDGLLDNREGAYIYDQIPVAGENTLTGDTIQLFLSSSKPFNCED